MRARRWPVGASMALLCAAALAWSGCGEDDLGECNMLVLGGNALAGMEAPHAGQVVMQTSCSGGRCHSATAIGDARVGAPADLDFDVIPSANTLDALAIVARGGANVRENAGEIWENVSGGDMPPAPPAGTGELGSQDRETLRNWLACNAPVIAAAPSGGNADPWTDVHTRLMGPGGPCAACHSNATGAVSGGGFVLGDDACSAYANVVNAPAVGSGCATSGLTLVVPGDPASSLLVRKLDGGPTPCGSPMPLGTSNPFATAVPDVFASLQGWIQGGAPKPPTCP